MCGIAGIFTRKLQNDSNLNPLRAMTDAIAHRGPDDFGFLILDSRDGSYRIGRHGVEQRPGDVCFGHRRLAIIDLSTNGRQPVQNESGDIFLVFSGEVFNYLELRSELAAEGHLFRTQSDTEVVLHAYQQWGRDCVGRFNGMWALAIWDQCRRELFCSRDRFGIKPFFYAIDQDRFLFCSEIKGLLPALGGRPQADPGPIRDYLVDGSLCGTRDTFFAGIKRLEPAHNLVVSSRGFHISRYWDYDRRSLDYDDRRPVDTFRELVYDAVRLRLRSDVPVGIALSGGLDSTSVLGCAARLAPKGSLKAFTAIFPGERFNEYPYARAASEALGVKLFLTAYSDGKFLRDLGCAIRCLDHPALDGQVLLRWRLMRLASRHVKVILEGQGADELLAGYIAKYFTAYALDELSNLRPAGRFGRLRQLWGACLEVHRRHAWPNTALFLRKIRKSLGGNRGAPTAAAPFKPDFLSIPGGKPDPASTVRFGDRLTRLMHFDHSAGILPLLLQYGDAFSMAASIESRLPFLDHRLVEFVFGLPAYHKLQGSLSKGILRQAMAGAIPEEIRSRRDKIGFTTPLGKWIGDNLDAEVRPLLLSQRCRMRGIFDDILLDRALKKNTLRNSRMAHLVFRWISTELWFRLFIDGEAPPC